MGFDTENPFYECIHDIKETMIFGGACAYVGEVDRMVGNIMNNSSGNIIRTSSVFNMSKEMRRDAQYGRILKAHTEPSIEGSKRRLVGKMFCFLDGNDGSMGTFNNRIQIIN